MCKGPLNPNALRLAMAGDRSPRMQLQPLRDLLTLAPDRSGLDADSPERLSVETVRLFTAGMR